MQWKAWLHVCLDYASVFGIWLQPCRSSGVWCKSCSVMPSTFVPHLCRWMLVILQLFCLLPGLRINFWNVGRSRQLRPFHLEKVCGSDPIRSIWHMPAVNRLLYNLATIWCVFQTVFQQHQEQPMQQTAKRRELRDQEQPQQQRQQTQQWLTMINNDQQWRTMTNKD